MINTGYDSSTEGAMAGQVEDATPDFLSHSEVMNWASDVFVQVFGDAGRHSRMAVGVSALPYDAAVEVEAVFEVR
jgi:enamine deaminase RidA (YjgF/YER057c/UK114 family)